MSIKQLLEYWAGRPVYYKMSWIDHLEHLFICLTNKNPNFICPHKEEKE